MIEIRRAQPREAETLTKLAHAAKAHWGYPTSWIKAWHDSLTFTHDYIAQHIVFIACIQERIVGVYALMKEDGIVYLDHMWVDPQHIGKGVGKALMQHMVLQAKQKDIREIEIWSDPQAEGFYLYMGAHRVGTVPAAMDTAPDRVLPKLIFSLGAETVS